MQFYVGLDVSLKRTEICVVDEAGRMHWRGVADTHPEMIAEKLDRWRDGLARVGLETGSMTPWLARGLLARGLPVVVMDARRAADALKARPVKTDRADARALAEMLQTGWYTEVFVKSEESHRRRALSCKSRRQHGTPPESPYFSGPSRAEARLCCHVGRVRSGDVVCRAWRRSF